MTIATAYIRIAWLRVTVKFFTFTPYAAIPDSSISICALNPLPNTPT